MGKVVPVLQENALGGVILKMCKNHCATIIITPETYRFKAKIGCLARRVNANWET